MPTTMRKIAMFALLTLGFAGSSKAAVTTFFANLSGASEVPPTGSAATGSALVVYDSTAHTLQVTEAFSGLTVPAAAAHIHCCTPPGTNAQVAVPFPAFPAATSGIYTNTFNLTLAATYTAGFLSSVGGTPPAAEAALASGFTTNMTYVNIHNANFPGGEIRGQLQLLVPTLTKSFGDSVLTFNPTTNLTFTVTNPTSLLTLNGLAFTDTLPTGMVVSSPSVITGACDGGTISAPAGTSTITLSGASLAGGASCTFSVNVTGPVSDGTLVNTTSTITSTTAGTGAGAAASASLTVQDSILFLWFFS